MGALVVGLPDAHSLEDEGTVVPPVLPRGDSAGSTDSAWYPTTAG